MPCYPVPTLHLGLYEIFARSISEKHKGLCSMLPSAGMFGREQEWCAQMLLSRRILRSNLFAADGGMIQLRRIKLRASAIRSRSLMLAAVLRCVLLSTPVHWSRHRRNADRNVPFAHIHGEGRTQLDVGEHQQSLGSSQDRYIFII